MRKKTVNEKRERDQEKPKQPEIISVKQHGDFRPQGQEITIRYENGKEETRIIRTNDELQREYGKYLKPTEDSSKEAEKKMERQMFFNTDKNYKIKKSKTGISNTVTKLGYSSE